MRAVNNRSDNRDRPPKDEAKRAEYFEKKRDELDKQMEAYTKKQGGDTTIFE